MDEKFHWIEEIFLSRHDPPHGNAAQPQSLRETLIHGNESNIQAKLYVNKTVSTQHAWTQTDSQSSYSEYLRDFKRAHSSNSNITSFNNSQIA